ncbi:MAG: hypothetical protein MJE77_19265 [Proteobacteria bacterium]|nr:hypothetical protein [Pseudomonadota bacterium]
MIARIHGYRDLTEYVALHIDEHNRDVWVPIRGDRGRSGEQEEIIAARICVTDLQKQIEPLVERSMHLYRLCDIRGREFTAMEKSQIFGSASSLATKLDRAGANLSRLLDQPTVDDNIDIDAAYAALQSP